LESNRSPNVDAGRAAPAHTKKAAQIRSTSLILEKPAIPDISCVSH
jgi:hypothetical protein